MTTTVWDLVREGWSVTWWATVDAIDTVFAHAPTALALPTGFASHVDDLLLDVAGDLGCEVLDDAGVAAGLSLAFELRDSAEVRALVAWPTRMQRLSQTETASATTLNLVDTSGLSSPVYVGHERVTFAGSTATTLTTVGRATGGSLASEHRAEGVGGIVASSPLPDWRGRRVRLYAAAIDPAGVQHGASLALVSTEVWSGYVDEGPYRTERGTWREVVAARAHARNAQRTAARKSQGPVLVLDAGDYSMGTAFSAATRETGGELHLMGKMGYDATTFGNHEFDLGPAGLGS